jgi:dienelactone hydrolase/membrane-bound inhibitor of C-type lysozyme
MLRTLFFIVIITFQSIIYSVSAAQPVRLTQNAGAAEGKGIDLIVKKLNHDNVFNTPVYTLESGYDNFKKYANIQGLFFDGLPYDGRKTKVFCWLGIPETAGKTNKVPAVVLVHGGGGTIFPEWIKKWTDRGYAAISVGLEGQLPGEKVSDTEPFWPRNENSGPWRKGFFQDADEEINNQWFYHAVADVILANSLLRSLPEIDPGKIGITGISWGGIITNVVAGIDHRFAFAIPVYGCGFLQETPTYVKQIRTLSGKKTAFYLDNWEPSLYVPLHSMPVLFVNGTNDCHFTMNSFTKTWETSSAEKHLLVLHQMAHGHAPGWNPLEIYEFADYVTGSRDQYPEIQITVSENSKIHGKVKGSLTEAFCYYTTDTADWQCKNYQWMVNQVEVNREKGTIKTTVPDNALYFFVNVVSADGLTVSSPMQRIGQWRKLKSNQLFNLNRNQ